MIGRYIAYTDNVLAVRAFGFKSLSFTCERQILRALKIERKGSFGLKPLVFFDTIFLFIPQSGYRGILLTLWHTQSTMQTLRPAGHKVLFFGNNYPKEVFVYYE